MIPQLLITACFTVLMLLGSFLLVFSVVRLAKAKKHSPSSVKVPGLKIEVSGPAWLVAAAIGALMLASPVIAGVMAKPANVTAAPPSASIEGVREIEEPNYAAFRFVRDVSVVDLRSTEEKPWYSWIPGLGGKKTRTRPGVVKNYMVVRKVAATNELRLTYATSGTMDVRCLTHAARYRKAERRKNGELVEAWEIIADVSAVPIGSEFEVAVEATYWNGFNGENGDDYATYAHKQVEPERLSVLILFPDDKPFTSVAVTEFAPNATTGQAIQGPWESRPTAGNKTYYWSIVNTRPEWYYKLAWNW